MPEKCPQIRGKDLFARFAKKPREAREKIRKFAANAKNMITKECENGNCYLCFDEQCKCKCHEIEKEEDELEDTEEDGEFGKELSIDDFEDEE